MDTIRNSICKSPGIGGLELQLVISELRSEMQKRGIEYQSTNLNKSSIPTKITNRNSLITNRNSTGLLERG